MRPEERERGNFQPLKENRKTPHRQSKEKSKHS